MIVRQFKNAVKREVLRGKKSRKRALFVRFGWKRGAAQLLTLAGEEGFEPSITGPAVTLPVGHLHLLSMHTKTIGFMFNYYNFRSTHLGISISPNN